MEFGTLQARCERHAQVSASAGWIVMAETLAEFIVRRRRELDQEAARLQSEMDALQVERDRIDRVADMIGIRAGAIDATEENLARVLDNQRRLTETTIKVAVQNVLASAPKGMTSLEILAVLNRVVNVPYQRTSLSPQLSRLKAEGKIHREGRIWKLGPAVGAESEDDTSDDG